MELILDNDSMHQLGWVRDKESYTFFKTKEGFEYTLKNRSMYGWLLICVHKGRWSEVLLNTKDMASTYLGLPAYLELCESSLKRKIEEDLQLKPE
jgi:hypothetical protein